MIDLPNLFSRIFSGAVKTFHEAEAEVEALYQGAVKVFPPLAVVVDAEKSALKQQISNAFSWADTELNAHYGDAVSMVESAADTFVVGATGGQALPAVPILNASITNGFALLRSVLDHKEAAARAAMLLPAATSSAAPSFAGVGAAAVQAAAGAAVEIEGQAGIAA